MCEGRDDLLIELKRHQHIKEHYLIFNSVNPYFSIIPLAAKSHTIMNNDSGHTTHGSIFDDLGRSAEEAENLKIRAQLLDSLIDYIETRGLSQEEAARRLGTSQPRVSDVLNGRISKFTIDALINMHVHAGIPVRIEIGKAAA